MKVYLSKPNDIDSDHLADIYDYLKVNFPNWEVATHEPGTKYSDIHKNWVKTCDILLVVPSKNSSSYVGKGSYSEIQSFNKNNPSSKKFILYKRVFDNMFQFYDFNTSTTGYDDFKKYGLLYYNSCTSDSLYNNYSGYSNQDRPDYKALIRKITKKIKELKGNTVDIESSKSTIINNCREKQAKQPLNVELLLLRRRRQ